MDIKKQKKSKYLDLSLTMQQKFNFDSKKIEDELEVEKKLYKKRNEVISLKRKILELEKSNNRYKVVILILSIFSILSFGIGIFFAYSYITFEPKVITKKIVLGGENIVFLGDSITEQYDLEKYYANMSIVNSGISGNTTDDILSNMYERVYRYNPTKVILLIGVNDLGSGKTVDSVYQNILKIISEIKENRPSTKIYVESIYPINDSTNEKIEKICVNNKDISELNKKLKNHFVNNDVEYIDINEKLKDDDGRLKLEYTKDGLHITELGYSKITKILLPYLKNSSFK